MARHELKTLPQYYDDVVRGTKPFEIRIDDRGYEVGDVLELNEWDKIRGYSGRCFEVTVGYVLRDAEKFGLAPGHVVMGIAPAPEVVAKQRARVARALDVAACVALWAALIASRISPAAAVATQVLATILVGAATFLRGRT